MITNAEQFTGDLMASKASTTYTKPASASDENDSGSLKRLEYPFNFRHGSASTEKALEILPSNDFKVKAEASVDGLVFCTLATANYLPFAAIAIESFVKYHPEAKVLLMIVDQEERPKGLPDDWIVVSPKRIGVPNFSWLAAKYDATDLCCAMKPFLVLEAKKYGDRAVFADSDIETFSRFGEMLEILEEAPFVVTPHLIAPMPRPERFWERPTIGDIAYSGVLNAGLFAVNFRQSAERFLGVWAELVTQPGAFFNDLGPQMEQNAFNWITAFESRTRVLSAPRYNVAYWNLEDRSLRWNELDGGDPETWSVNGEPLACFHFSGFDPHDGSRLSKHDYRHPMLSMPSVWAICRRYSKKYKDAQGRYYVGDVYNFAALPNGQVITPRMRWLLKRNERLLNRDIDPWTEKGAVEFCRLLMMPLPACGSLLPFFFADVYDNRPDLKSWCPDADTNPAALSGWIASHGVRETGTEIAFAVARPMLPKADLAELANTDVFKSLPPGLNLGKGRFDLADYMRLKDEKIAVALYECKYEIFKGSSLALIRDIHFARYDLQKHFPDPFGHDFEGFNYWLRTGGAKEYSVDESDVLAFAKVRGDISLARIASYLGRRPDLMDRFPRALIGDQTVELMPELLRQSGESLEFGVEDVVAMEWIVRIRPELGLKFLLELPVNRVRDASRTRKGARKLVAGVLDDDRFNAAYSQYSNLFSKGEIALDEIVRRQPPEKSQSASDVVDLELAELGVSRFEGYTSQRREALRKNPALKDDAYLQPSRNGVNLFGYFVSNIGLGSSTDGLAQSLNAINVPYASHTLTNSNMSRLRSAEDLMHHFRYDYDTNVFVSFPHADRMLTAEFPEMYFKNRRNIVHLAWEQRDHADLWKRMFAFSDQIWTISDFAAIPLRRLFGDRVHVIPNILNLSLFPQKASKKDFGFSENEFVALYVFDANSSVERKNPEAVVTAFGKAFGGENARKDVRLVLKVGHFFRPDHRARMDKLIELIRRYNIRATIIGHTMPYADVLRLMSVSDCYLSLHRAEGFGYTCAEAMSYGVPVVATNYSGNLEFMNDKVSFLVDAGEVLVGESDGPFQRGSVWGDPSTDHAAEQLRFIFNNRSKATVVAMAGRNHVHHLLSAESVGQRIKVALES